MSENLETLLEVTGEKPQGKRESDQDFLKRLLEAVHGLADSKWKALPRDLKNWFNEGSDAFNEDQPIPIIPGMDEEEEEDEPAPRGRGRGRGKAPATRGRGRGRKAAAEPEDEEEEEPDEEEEEDEAPAPRGRGRGRGRGKAAASSRGRGRSKAAAKPAVPEPVGEVIGDAEDTEDGDEVTLIVKDGRAKKMQCGEVVDLTARALVLLDFVTEQEEKVPLAKIVSLHEYDEADLAALQEAPEEEEEEDEAPAPRGRGRGRGRGKAAAPARGRGRGRKAAEPDEEEEEDEPAPRRGRGRGRASAASKKAPARGRGRGRGAKSDDAPEVPVSRRIRQIMAAKPTTTQKQMEAALKKEGYDAKVNTIRLTMSGFTEVYEALQAEERIVED